MTEQQVDAIASKMKKFSIQTCKNVPFCGLTTLGVGGTIKLVIYVKTKRQLLYAVRTLFQTKTPYLVLGNGSNVLASDDEYDGVVIINKASKISIHGRTVTVFSGTSTVTLAKQLQLSGLTGGEFMACLPATVGGAVVGNAGCYGQDVAGVLTKVTVFYRGCVRVLSAAECRFSKRNSLFKQDGDYTVLSATFKLNKSDPETVKNTISAMREKKARSQPLNYRSAGCVLYHNRVAVSRLIDNLGLKGYSVGGAQVSTKHAGFVVNVDKATSKDIYLVIQYVARQLNEYFGIVPKLEVRLVNYSKEENDILAGR